MTIPKTVALPLGDTPIKQYWYIYDTFFVLARVFYCLWVIFRRIVQPRIKVRFVYVFYLDGKSVYLKKLCNVLQRGKYLI